MKARPMMDRLEAVFDIVPHAEAIADIGTDHGYLAVELIVRGKAKCVIAGDV
ncbi:MAG: tRNA (adenine(22)-N(1))-methyltransferase TrmK, partial [Veillonella sp.]|nr:tRNA (adenine(22)-N(1))-methyltransferase TrmK [Veillonella sp.]